MHLAYVRERVGHALIGTRQWIPTEHLEDSGTVAAMGIPAGHVFRTKGQLAIDICTDAYADGVAFDFVCGDEVYGNCTQLREFFEDRQQAYVLRVASTFMITLNAETRMTCAKAVALLASDEHRWQIRSAGAGSKGQRWYAWAWIATSSPRRYLLVRRHLTSGELAFHYCYVPNGQPLTLARFVRAAGLRWPIEENVRVQQGLLWPRSIPSPAAHRGHPTHRAGHERLGHLRDRRCSPQDTDRLPSPATEHAYETKRFREIRAAAFVHKLRYKYRPHEVTSDSYLAHLIRRDLP